VNARPGGSLQATALTVSAGSTTILEDVDVSVGAGHVLGVIGPNGSGKSTLVRCLAGITPADRGTVTLDGDVLTDLGVRGVARQLAFVGQAEHTDIDHRVHDVVRLGRLPHRGRFGGATTADTTICEAALASVGLGGFEARHWNGLSGGERQRVHIARALAQEPQVLVLDEPLNHLDIHHQFELLDLLRALPTTVVLVLHDIPLAARYCDELLVLDEGRAVAAGSPTNVVSPTLIADVFRVQADVRKLNQQVHVELVGSLTSATTD